MTDERLKALSRQLPRHRKMLGFSVIELLVVIGLILIIMAIATPQLVNYLRVYRLNNDARALVNELTVARMRAAAVGGRAEMICDTATSGATALTCGIAIRQVGATSYSGFLPAAIQVANPVYDVPTRLRLTGTDSFGFPPSAVSGAGLSGVQGQYGSTPFNCNAIVFNSRGLPIFDSLANIATAGTAGTCGASASNVDGQRKYNYVMYLQSGESTYMAVVVDGGGNISIWRWSPQNASWGQVSD